MPQPESTIERIMRHEGRVTQGGLHVVFKDSRNKATLGYGSLVQAPGGLTEEEAVFLLGNRVDNATEEASKYPWFPEMNAARQSVIVELLFQLGPTGFNEFVKMIGALENGNYDAAADELVNSDLGKEAPARTNELADTLRNG